MRRTALIFLACQQACFLGGLAVCIALRPEGLGANAGVSYYGNFFDTFPFYALSMLGTALFSLLAARVITVPAYWPLRQGLLAIAFLTAVITLTPYTRSAFVDLSHTLAGIIMFTIQLAISVWALVKLNWSAGALTFVLLETATGIVSVMFVLPAEGYLIQAQIGFQVAFAGLLFFAFKGLLPREGE
ncbi:MAG TPA: hypothetical protein VFX84_00210 [Candidatus Saccharimonadales bacterium]|nr:hypothetical protein [Candidatus Saccharimonadales bacterium]